jgi:hypothetical protein
MAANPETDMKDHVPPIDADVTVGVAMLHLPYRTGPHFLGNLLPPRLPRRSAPRNDNSTWSGTPQPQAGGLLLHFRLIPWGSDLVQRTAIAVDSVIKMRSPHTRGLTAYLPRLC